MGGWTAADPNAPLNNGIFYVNSDVDDRDISDGMSNTILLGESQFGGFWADNYGCCARWRDDQPSFDGHWTGTGQAACSTTGSIHFFSFGSFHSDVANFALCDGSGRSLAKNMDGQVFRSLCTRNGGEAITKEF